MVEADDAFGEAVRHLGCRAPQDVPEAEHSHPAVGMVGQEGGGQEGHADPASQVAGGRVREDHDSGCRSSGEPAPLAQAREEARIIASTAGSEGPAKSHRLIEHTLGQLRKGKAGEKGLIAVGRLGVIHCEVAAHSIERLAEVLPKIVQAAAHQGFELKPGQSAAVFERDGETVGFSITEQVKREKHVLTEKEQATLDAWERKRDRQIARRSWDWSSNFDRPTFPEWDYRPTGHLTFEFEHSYFWGLSPRRSFRDAKVQRLEDLAEDIAVGLAVFAAAKVEDRLRREAEARRIEDERRKREEAARARHVEGRRLAGLTTILAEVEEMQKLRTLIRALVDHASSDPSPRVSVFIDWAQEHLSKREALLSPGGIEKRFADLQLFGDTDDYDFKTSRW